jgi:hypothetical protein
MHMIRYSFSLLLFQATPHIDVRTGPGQHFVFTIEPDSKVAPGTVAFSLPQVQPGGPGHGGLLTTSGTARWPQARWPFHYLRYSKVASGIVAFSLPQVQPGDPGHGGLLTTSGTARWPRALWPSHYLRYSKLAPGTVPFSLPYLRYSQVAPGTVAFSLPQVQPGGPGHGGILTTSGTGDSKVAPGTVAFSLPQVLVHETERGHLARCHSH